MKLNYLEAKDIRPAKKYALGKNNELEVASYPNIRNFTSFEEEVSNVNELYESLRSNAAAGVKVLLKGRLDRPLDNESRAGHTNRTHSTEWMVLDVDGTTEEDVEAIVRTLGLDSYSYVIQYSSSYGIVRDGLAVKSGLRCHLYFMFDGIVAPHALKNWIKWCNIKHFPDDMALTGAGFSLVWPLDPSVADNSKLIYIAPAICKEPFVDTITEQDRIVLVEKDSPFVPRTLIKSVSNAVVASKVEDLIKDRRREAGLRKREIRTKHEGKGSIVLDNPDPGSLSFVGSDRGFSYYNLNGGDSVAYYHPIGNPDIIHSFKPEDYSFRHMDVDLDSYGQALERANEYKTEIGESFRGVGRDIMLDKFFSYCYNPKVNEIETIEIARQNIQDHLANHDLVVPDPIPDYQIMFDPTDDRVFDPTNRWINSFSDNDYGRTFRGTHRDPELVLDNLSEALNNVAPYTAALMYHVLGNDKSVMDWFLNWLGWLVQERIKPGTSIVMHGVPGTGKNVLMEHVIRPIFGDDYFFEIRMDHLNDSFTGWMKEARMILINEANEVSMAGDGSKVGELLKNIITEQRLALRGMRQMTKTFDTYFGVIIASNSNTPVILDSSDRRFTVAERQEEPLDRIGEYVVKANFFHLVEQWESERSKVAELLYRIMLDHEMAHTALDNHAKTYMVDAGRTSTAEFCEMVKHGNLDYFLEAIPDDALQTTFSTTVLTMANTNKLMLQRFLNNIGEPMAVTADELRLLYMMMTGATQNINPIKFGKMLIKNGLPLRGGLRRNDTGRKTFRGLTIKWVLVSTTVEDAMNLVDTAWRASSTNLTAADNPPDFLLQ